MDMFEGTVIKQTKQTNDIASIETRQTNFTPQFDLPKTPNNVAAMQHLSLVGNTSDIPYQKNEAFLYSSTGECFIYKGWAIIKETTKVYKCYIYDGNLELYKAIENVLLSDLDLSELTHQKDVQTVIDSWTNENYRYILADYNGKTAYGNDNEKINIDYLVPSVRIKYLWNKIFETFGFSYSGSIFQTQEFDNLWMTYPKGVNTSDADEPMLVSDDYSFQRKQLDSYPFGPQTNNSYYAKAESWNVNELVNFNNGIFMRVPETGNYRLEISGTLNRFNSNHWPVGQIIIGRNTEAIYPHSNQVQPGQAHWVIPAIVTDEPFEASINLSLNQFDSICLVIKGYDMTFPWYRLNEDTSNLNVDFVQLNPNNIDFEEAFLDFSITDFLKEVITDFGLSMFKDKYTNHYQFLTMAERLQFADVEIWTDKYDSKIGEDYIYGNYAQQNILRHKYNDDEDNYNDGSISVANVNLNDRRTMFQSKVYTPERLPVDYFGFQTHQYRLFDKEFDEKKEEFKYKSLSKRFHFIRARQISFNEPTTIGSEVLLVEDIVNSAYVESYWKLPKKDIVNDYYPAIMSILNRSLIVRIVNTLSEIDVVNVDFKKLIYYRQEQAYFMLNKVNNYEVGEKTVTELVKIDRSQLSTPEPFIHFGFGITEKNSTTGQVVDIWLSTIYNLGAFEIEVENVVKINDYHYQVTPANPGVFNIKMIVSSNRTNLVLESNEIVLTVE